jgi:hypothetical protein
VKPRPQSGASRLRAETPAHRKVSEGGASRRQAALRRAGTDSRDFPVSAKMQLPDKNVRPIGFFESLHSLPQRLGRFGAPSQRMHKRVDINVQFDQNGSVN